MNFNPLPYPIGQAVIFWLILFGSVTGIVLAIALFTSLVARGLKGPAAVLGQVRDFAVDMIRLSPRRVFALSSLTFKEAIRRKALLIFVVFALLFMFGGWFLSGTGERPDEQARVYISFVLRVIGWLTLPVVLLLSCWGIPEDIRARSLHTVVTKPARRNEIFLGRFLGFSAVGSIIVVIMGVVGYFWIVRQTPSDLVARVPRYGDLAFLDREGNPGRGVNVGDMWEFRSYVEGATRARGLWRFKDVYPGDNPDEGLVLESRFEAFRTHKGDMERGLLCELSFFNPETELRVRHRPFQVKEFSQNEIKIDRKLSMYDEETNTTKEVDLFDDLITDGTLYVEARAIDPGQYLGMARPDLFIRMANRPFYVGYAKAVFGIWMMAILVVALGVTASCFVKGPVATLLTLTFLIIGQGFREFMDRMVFQNLNNVLAGGGPVESWIRLIRHMNPQVPMEPGVSTSIIQFVDARMFDLLWIVQHIVPDFRHFRMAPYIANGFDVNFESAIVPGLAVMFGYLLPCLLLGYFSLKLRELEAK
ncbi:MAG: ABC transporter permease [Planctomycetaceae bacterium]|nr:ABC transporter permease [Planctomycetaceae bacterium]